MPVFVFETNIPSDKIPKNFLKSTSELIANILGKPESYVCVHIKVGQEHLMFGGTSEPCGNASLSSIGKVGGDTNKSHSAKISAHIKEHLGIPSDRFYINFTDLARADVGYNGGTFA